MLDEGRPSREQVDALECDFLGVLKLVLEKQSVQLAAHIVNGP